jgi:hypothetical protein
MASGRAAADHDLPQSAAGADDRPAGHAVQCLRAACSMRGSREPLPAAPMMHRAGDAEGRELRRHRPAGHLHPSRHWRRNAAADHHPARAQPARHARCKPSIFSPIHAPSADQRASAARRCRCRPRASCSTMARSSAACACSGRWNIHHAAGHGRNPLAGGRPRGFAAAWAAEIAQIPEFTDSTIHIVAGLLLPIWKRLPDESTRVYRLQTDDGERIIGRRVSPAWAANASTIGAPSR